MAKITFKKDGNCLYLVEDLIGMTDWEKAKAIENFKVKETKLFEKMIDNEIYKIFKRNGVNIYSTEKSVLQGAFDTLKRKGKGISIEDIYEKDKIFGCVKVADSDRQGSFNIWLEDDRYLQCGCRVCEVRL